MSEKLRDIAISSIDLSDERYQIALSSSDTEWLARSIKGVGLVSPPILQPMGHRYAVVSGFNRIKALGLLEVDSVKAVVQGPPAGDRECLLTAVAALSFKRPLTHAELIVGATRLAKFMDTAAMAEQSAGIFNVPLSQSFVRELLEIGALPDPAPTLIHQGRMSLKSAKALARLGGEFQTLMLEVFANIRASVSVQLELIQNLTEISARDDLGPERLLMDIDPGWPPVLDEKNDSVAVTRDFRTRVFEKRFPELSMARQNVRKMISAMNLPAHISIKPPEYFEGRNFSVSFQARTFDDFQAGLQRLRVASEHPDFDKLFEL